MKIQHLLLCALLCLTAACTSSATKKFKETYPNEGERMVQNAEGKLRSGDVGTAERRYLLALDIYQKVDDRPNIAAVYHRLAGVALIDGNTAKAREYLSEAKSIAANDRYAALAFNIGITESSLLTAEGKPDEAETLLRSIGTPPDAMARATLANASGRVAMAQSAYDRAQALFEEALDTALSKKDLSVESAARVNLGVLFIRTEHLEYAIGHLRRALAIDKSAGLTVSIGSTLHLLGQAYEALGDRKNALYYYKRALGVNEQIDSSRRADADRDAIQRLRGGSN